MSCPAEQSLNRLGLAINVLKQGKNCYDLYQKKTDVKKTHSSQKIG